MDTSREAAVAAIRIAVSESRGEEQRLRKEFEKRGIRTAAVDFGGAFESSVAKILEKAVVAARREGVIAGSHAEEGAVAGAAHEAISQIITKSAGLNLGGKIGIARYKEHLCVCIFFAIGMLHLNEVGIGLGHRVI